MVKKYAIVINTANGQCFVADKKYPDYKKQDVIYYPVDKNWYLENKFMEDSAKVSRRLAYYKEQKYQEITLAYDKVCNYGVVPVSIIMVDSKKGTTETKEYYANRSWLGTWQEVLAGLQFTKGKAFVRLYEKLNEKNLKNVTLENISLEQYNSLYLQLVSYRFNNLQPIRNELYEKLEKCETVDEIMALKVSFDCLTVDEQNDTEHIIVKETIE